MLDIEFLIDIAVLGIWNELQICLQPKSRNDTCSQYQKCLPIFHITYSS